MTVRPGIGALREGGLLHTLSHKDQFTYLLVSLSDASAAVAALGAGGKALIYMDGTRQRQEFFTGVNYSDLISNDLILKTAGGARINFGPAGYPTAWMPDPGSATYQSLFVSQVEAFISAHGMQGVFIDDISRYYSGAASGTPALYPTRSSYEAAVLEFVQQVGPAFIADGYYVLLNAVGYIPGDSGSDTGAATVDWWTQLAPSCSGLLQEGWEERTDTSAFTPRYRGTAAFYEHFDSWLDIAAAAQDNGADFHGISYGQVTDFARMRYVRAAYLLKWNGGTGAFWYGGNNPDDSHDLWSEEWTMDIGTPTELVQTVGVGYKRAFTNGIVLCNPDPTSSQAFTLGATYEYPDGTSVSGTLTLQPKTGVILQGAGSVPPGNPVNTIPPMIQGNAIVGSALMCTTGGWTNSPTSYTYQWERVGVGAIGGATSNMYTPTNADVGYRLDCVVTAHN